MSNHPVQSRTILLILICTSCNVIVLCWVHTGTEIVCSTTLSNVELNVNVSVEIWRMDTNKRATYHSFKYALPVISSVFPLYGPISGGTRVIIRGSELNISDTALTTATIAGIECDIRLLKSYIIRRCLPKCMQYYCIVTIKKIGTC